MTGDTEALSRILANTEAIAVSVGEQMERNDTRLRVVEREVIGAPGSPGHGERIRAIERDLGRSLSIVKWLGSGGIVGLSGALVLLYKIAAALADGPGPP